MRSIIDDKGRHVLSFTLCSHRGLQQAIGSLKSASRSRRNQQPPPSCLQIRCDLTILGHEESRKLFGEFLGRCSFQFHKPLPTDLRLVPVNAVMSGYDFGAKSLSIAAIASALNQLESGQLQALSMHYVSLNGSIEPFIKALGRHSQSLECFGCCYCCFRGSDPLALSRRMSLTLIRLKKVIITFRTGADFPLESMVEFATCWAQNKSLEALHINELPMTLKLQPLFAALQISSSVKALSINGNGCYRLTPLTAHYAAQMLEQNTSIQSFRAHLPRKGVPISLFFGALSRNSTLRHLSLGSAEASCPLALSDIKTIVKILKTQNDTLRQLTTHNSSYSTNEISAELDFYLRLNRFNRKQLLGNNENATQEDWIHTIIAAKDDVPVVFYYLSRNPSLVLCMCAGAACLPLPA